MIKLNRKSNRNKNNYLKEGVVMNARNTAVANEKRLLDANEVCVYLSLGRNRGVEFAKAIGSERKIGRRRLYDKVIIDRYLDAQAEEVE